MSPQKPKQEKRTVDSSPSGTKSGRVKSKSRSDSQSRISAEARASLQEKYNHVRALFDERVKNGGIQSAVQALGRSIENGTSFEDFGIPDPSMAPRTHENDGLSETALLGRWQTPLNSSELPPAGITPYNLPNAQHGHGNPLGSFQTGMLQSMNSFLPGLPQNPQPSITNGISPQAQLNPAVHPALFNPNILDPNLGGLQGVWSGDPSLNLMQGGFPAMNGTAHFGAPPATSQGMNGNNQQDFAAVAFPGNSNQLGVIPSSASFPFTTFMWHASPGTYGGNPMQYSSSQQFDLASSHTMGVSSTTSFADLGTSSSNSFISAPPMMESVEPSSFVTPTDALPASVTGVSVLPGPAFSNMTPVQENARLTDACRKLTKQIQNVLTYTSQLAGLEAALTALAEKDAGTDYITKVNKVLAFLEPVQGLSTMLSEMKVRTEKAQQQSNDNESKTQAEETKY